MKEELDSFIHDDKILSATFCVFDGGDRHGTHLDSLLKQLLKIAIVQGTEEAVFNFEKCTEETRGSFQTIALLEGIKLDAKIQAFEGIHLIPLPSSESEFPTHFGSIPSPGASNSYFGKTVIVTNYSIFPIFRKPASLAKTPDEPDSYVLFLPGIGSPVPTDAPDEWAKQIARFKVEVDGGKFPDFKEADFYNDFCQALSLACNSAVQVALRWKFIAQDELFSANAHKSAQLPQGPFGDPVEVGEAQIEKAKCLYERLTKLNQGTFEKLRIPIDRWIKSKAEQNPVDKMIDLGIALESLYLSGTESKNEIRFRFSLHAAWHLGEDKEHREGLMKKFKAIYDWRSAVVHTGKLPEKGKGKKKKPYTQEEVREFIRNAQDLCRDSIIKILEDGEFPDWNNLILG